MNVADLVPVEQIKEWENQYKESVGFAILAVDKYWRQTKKKGDIVFIAALKGVSLDEYWDYLDEYYSKTSSLDREGLHKKICNDHTLWSNFFMDKYHPQEISNFKLQLEKKLAGYIVWGASKYSTAFDRMTYLIDNPEKEERLPSVSENNRDQYDDYTDLFEYIQNHD